MQATTSRRSFVAIELPGDVIDGLVEAQRDLLSAGSRAGATVEVVPRAHLQITLEDLGHCHDEALEAVDLAIERLLPRHPPFGLRVRGFGAFPDRQRPRIVWARVIDDRGRLEALREELHHSLARFGFPVDARTYCPHVALARVSAELGPLGDELGDTPFGSVRVKRLAVFRRRPPAMPGPGFRASWARPLERFPGNAERPVDEQVLRAEIAAQLDQRLERRSRRADPPQAESRRRIGVD